MQGQIKAPINEALVRGLAREGIPFFVEQNCLFQHLKLFVKKDLIKISFNENLNKILIWSGTSPTVIRPCFDDAKFRYYNPLHYLNRVIIQFFGYAFVIKFFYVIFFTCCTLEKKGMDEWSKTYRQKYKYSLIQAIS